MRALVDHTVMLFLDEDEQFVVPRRGGHGYVRVDGITVRFPHKRDPQVSAGGLIVRKDGQLGKGWGRTITSADLPDEEVWVKRAKEMVRGLTREVAIHDN